MIEANRSSDLTNKLPAKAVVIGGGPAGLMAAEVLIKGGVQIDLYDSMPSVGRKFLMAGKGGMNISHAEAEATFLARYGTRREQLAPLLKNFGVEALCEWVHGLGINTFVGSSGRIFPTTMKAAPLLRAWLHRLRTSGVRFHMRHRWCGWTDDRSGLRFTTPQEEVIVEADAVVLALGGGSWARLGSDGAWMPLLAQRGVSTAPLLAANCGFDVGWSEHFSSRFAGHPLKSVVLSVRDADGNFHKRQGDLVVTSNGLEGGPIYALSAILRDEISRCGEATIYIDLSPGKDRQKVLVEVAHARGSRSMSSHLQSRAKLKGVKTGLLRELLPVSDFDQAERLACAIKSLPLRLIAPRPLDEAISTAGGVEFAALDSQLMLRAIPGVFCAGEMLDWEAPTGGYLLTACFSSGHNAGLGVLNWLDGGKISG